MTESTTYTTITLLCTVQVPTEEHLRALLGTLPLGASYSPINCPELRVTRREGETSISQDLYCYEVHGHVSGYFARETVLRYLLEDIPQVQAARAPHTRV